MNTLQKFFHLVPSLAIGPLVALWARQRVAHQLGAKHVGFLPRRAVRAATMLPRRRHWRVAILAGGAMCLITSVLYVFSLSVFGDSRWHSVIEYQAIVAPQSRSWASEAGFAKGDQVTSVDGVAVETWFELSSELERHAGSAADVVVKRNGAAKPKTLHIAVPLDKKFGLFAYVAPRPLRLSRAILEGFSAPARRWYRLAFPTKSFSVPVITASPAEFVWAKANRTLHALALLFSALGLPLALLVAMFVRIPLSEPDDKRGGLKLGEP